MHKPLHGMLPVLATDTKVRLPDGTTGYATPDRRVGYTWDGSYRVRSGTCDRVDVGWRRSQLELA